eukprot:gene5456-6312_t
MNIKFNLSLINAILCSSIIPGFLPHENFRHLSQECASLSLFAVQFSNSRNTHRPAAGRRCSLPLRLPDRMISFRIPHSVSTHLPWRGWLLPLLLSLLLACSLSPPAARAQPVDDAATADQRLDGLRKQITTIQKALDGDADLDDATLSQMKADALAASAEADKVAESLVPILSSVQARLAELGKPAAGAKEAPDVAAQRSQLDRTSSALDAQVKLARLLAVEATQASEQVSTARRAQLQARLGERTASILAGSFWKQLHGELPQNLQRLRALELELANAARATPWSAWGGLLAAVVAVIGASIWASRYLLVVTATRVPHGRLRRSLHALAVIVLALATPGLPV